MAVYDPNFGLSNPTVGISQSSPLYGGGFSGGTNYMGSPQAPFAFSNTGNAPSATPATNPMGAKPSGINPLGGVLGAFQVAQGIIGMKKLEKEAFPEYKVTKDLAKAKSRSGQMSQMGFTPSERAAYMAQMGMSLNQDYQNAVNMAGGNLSQALNARRSGQRLASLNQFAQGDAMQRMNNIRYDDGITGQLQNLQNMNTQIALQRRMALEQAYGGAIKAGTENIVNSFDAGQAIKMMAGMG